MIERRKKIFYIKISMLNRIVHDKADDSIVLYNSYIGVGSIQEFNISKLEF